MGASNSRLQEWEKINWEEDRETRKLLERLPFQMLLHIMSFLEVPIKLCVHQQYLLPKDSKHSLHGETLEVVCSLETPAVRKQVWEKVRSKSVNIREVSNGPPLVNLFLGDNVVRGERGSPCSTCGHTHKCRLTKITHTEFMKLVFGYFRNDKFRKIRFLPFLTPTFVFSSQIKDNRDGDVDESFGTLMWSSIKSSVSTWWYGEEDEATNEGMESNKLGEQEKVMRFPHIVKNWIPRECGSISVVKNIDVVEKIQIESLNNFRGLRKCVFMGISNNEIVRALPKNFKGRLAIFPSESTVVATSEEVKNAIASVSKLQTTCEIIGGINHNVTNLDCYVQVNQRLKLLPASYPNLRKLTISSLVITDSDIESSVLLMKNLTVLHIGRCSKIAYIHTIVLILKNLAKLKRLCACKLQLKSPRYDLKSHHYRGIESNLESFCMNDTKNLQQINLTFILTNYILPNLKELRMLRLRGHSIQAVNFRKNPNVESLTISFLDSFNSREKIRSISNDLQRLRYLAVNLLTPKWDKGIFNDLFCLKVETLWVGVVFTERQIYYFPKNEISNLSKNVNLKHLAFHAVMLTGKYYNEIDAYLPEKVMKRCENLDIFECHFFNQYVQYDGMQSAMLEEDGVEMFKVFFAFGQRLRKIGKTRIIKVGNMHRRNGFAIKSTPMVDVVLM